MKSNYGFTLIEILIVMVIISITAGIAVITINANQHKQFEMLGNRLINLMTLAEQEAMLKPATLGFALTRRSFQFYEYQENTATHQHVWKPIISNILGKHPIPNRTQLMLKIKDKIIPADGQPQLIISPSGDITPFILEIGKEEDEAYYQIIGKANGEVTLETIDPK